MSVSATADPQQTLDTTGVLRLPAGTTTLSVPLFLDASGSTITADDGATLECHDSGTGVVVGWKRGLVSDDHWTPAGWRTKADAFLFSRGTEWDLGPQSGVAGAWGGVQQLKVRWSGTRNGTTWHGVPLCGIQSNEDGYHVSPAPWQVAVDGSGKLMFAVRTSDNVIRQWSVPLADAVTDLDVTWSVDVTTGVCTCTLNGSSQTVTATLAGTGWNPALALRPNSRFPFGVGRMPPGCADSGYLWSEGVPPDLTVKVVEVTWNNGTAPNCQFYGTDPRPQTYAGGPSLPLASCHRGSSHYLFAVDYARQGTGASLAINVAVGGFKLNGRTGCPGICVGGLYGGTNLIHDIRGGGGTRFVQTMGILNYPLTVRDCNWKGASDRGVWLNRVSGLTLDRVGLDYCVRACGELVECYGVVRGGLIYAPPGPPAQDCVWKQVGGQVAYEYLISDYEYAVPPAMPFLDLTPFSNEGFATGARVIDCFGGTVPVAVNVNPRLLAYCPNGATTPVRVRWDSLGDRSPAVCTVAPGVNPELVGLTAAAR